MAAAVFGRDGELGSIQAFLERSEHGPAALVIAGEPGIGKTILWRAGVEHSRPEFAAVLSCRAVEAEATLAFAALADLLAEQLDPILASLTGPRRRALEVALILDEPGTAPPDPRAIGLALLDALRLLSASAPVLVAVDDIQWLDTSSAALLQFAFRRLRAERVALLATVRDAPGLCVPLELDFLERLSLGPLSLAALHHLLKDRLELELTRPELVRLSEATGGNPFFALELGRELARTDGRLAPADDLPLPGTLKELLGGRLARLPEPTRAVLLSVAALARPTVNVLAAAHGPEALDALERAARDGVVELEESRVHFTHPLLGAVCYQGAPGWRRRDAHRLLAEAGLDVEERVRHLALAATGPSADVAAGLDDAAEHVAERGATAAAAELAELAAELTPGDDPASRRRRLLRAADFHCYSGNRERAEAIPSALLAEVPSGRERAEVLAKLASARMVELPALVQICESALAEAEGDPALSARILAFRSWVRLEGDLPGALADARAALAQAERVGEPELLAGAIARVAIAEMLTADVTPGLLERGVALEAELARAPEFHESPRAALARYLLRSGDLDGARTTLEELEDRAAARGDEGTRAQILWISIMVEWLAGRWERALGHIAVALELAEQLRDDQYRATVLNAAAVVRAYLGRVDDARAAAEEAVAVASRVSDATFEIWSLGVLGHLALALGDVAAAGRHLTELPGRLLALGWRDPMVPLWSDALETLVALGSLEQARVYLDDYEERARRLERPWSVEVAGRCRGLLAAAEGDLAAAAESCRRVIAELPRAPYPFERGRTLLALGSILRRARRQREARDALEQSLGVFEQLGAALWAEKARGELARVGGRRKSSGGLTDMEERVATLAASGLSNKEIAATLVVTVHTVEAHLSRVYRKLEIRSRSELARRQTLGDLTVKV